MKMIYFNFQGDASVSNYVETNPSYSLNPNLNNSINSLTNELFNGYNPDIRPVIDPNSISYVSFNLTLSSLIALVCICLF